MIKCTLFSGKNRYQMVCIAKYVCSVPVGFEVKCNLSNSWHTTSGHLKVHKVDRYYQITEDYVE